MGRDELERTATFPIRDTPRARTIAQKLEVKYLSKIPKKRKTNIFYLDISSMSFTEEKKLLTETPTQTLPTSFGDISKKLSSDNFNSLLPQKKDLPGGEGHGVFIRKLRVFR